MRRTSNGLGIYTFIQDQEITERQAEFFRTMLMKACHTRKRKLHDIAFSMWEIDCASRTEIIFLNWKLW